MNAWEKQASQAGVLATDQPRDVPVVDVARRDSYAEAMFVYPVTDRDRMFAARAMAVADSELAGLRADVERLTEAWQDEHSRRESAETEVAHLDDVVHRLDQDVAEHINALVDAIERAEAAEAEVGRLREEAVRARAQRDRAMDDLERLREGHRALADEWDGYGHGFYNIHPERNLPCSVCDLLAKVRALLAPSPAATTGEATLNCPVCGSGEEGDCVCGPRGRCICDDPPVAREVVCRVHPNAHMSAPVSSGVVAGAGEAVCVPLRWVDEVVIALDSASIIGRRSCRPGDGLHTANHDRLIREAQQWSVYAESAKSRPAPVSSGEAEDLSHLSAAVRLVSERVGRAPAPVVAPSVASEGPAPGRSPAQSDLPTTPRAPA